MAGRVYISAGHNKRDPGACSDKSGRPICEAEEVRELADLVAQRLRQSGVEAFRDSWEMSWREAVDDANARGVALFVELHENAGGGDGAEVIIHNPGSQYIADAFRRQFEAMGQQWRRTIVDPAYWVLRYTDARAAIVEVCFVDSGDMRDFDSGAEKRRAADYLARAVCECIGVEFQPEREPSMVALELPEVRRGDTHPAARRCMMLLRDRGYLPREFSCGPGTVFGAAAEEALKAFQKRNGLTVDGWCGAKTWVELIVD